MFYLYLDNNTAADTKLRPFLPSNAFNCTSVLLFSSCWRTWLLKKQIHKQCSFQRNSAMCELSIDYQTKSTDFKTHKNLIYFNSECALNRMYLSFAVSSRFLPELSCTSPSIIPWILTNFPSPAKKNNSQSMMLPPRLPMWLMCWEVCIKIRKLQLVLSGLSTVFHIYVTVWG